jgi:GT2 family glycosyltransferase
MPAIISVIMVNYNGGFLTIDCLRSLEKQTFHTFEVVIVDNKSSDGSVALIDTFLRNSRLLSVTTIVRLESNLGFAGGNQEGVRFAKGQYFALLNNDTEPDEKWLEELVKTMDSDLRIGVCASKLMVYNSNRIDSAGDGYTTTLKGLKHGEGEESNKFNEQKFVFGACAGAALYRREMLEQIGFLDENFFLIHEDTDLNFRAQLASWKVLYVPTAIVYHKVRSSIGNMSDLAVYYTLRNSEFVRIKNVPVGVFIRCFPEFILGVISEFFYFAVKHKRFKLFMKAKMDAIKMFPRMWKKRKIIMKTRKVSNRYLLSLMTPIWQKDFFKAKLGKFLHD